MQPIQIGKRRIIFSEALIIPDGDSASLVLEHDGSPPLKVVVRFSDPDDAEMNKIEWKHSAGALTLTFGRGSGLLASTPKIVPLGTLNGREFSFAAFFQRAGDVGIVHLQFYREEG